MLRFFLLLCVMHELASVKKNISQLLIFNNDSLFSAISNSSESPSTEGVNSHFRARVGSIVRRSARNISSVSSFESLKASLCKYNCSERNLHKIGIGMSES